MSEINTSLPGEGEVTGTSEIRAAETPPADGEGERGGQTTRVFTQEEVNRLVQERLAEAGRRAAKKAAEDKAKEQGEWKTLAEQREAEVEELRKQVAAEAIRFARMEVARKHNVPDFLLGRLQGSTAEELDADAAAVMASLQALVPASPVFPGLPSPPIANPARPREKTLPPGIVRLEDIFRG